MTTQQIDSLTHSWTATVKLNNGQVIDIWYTAWPMSKGHITEVISIGSDYPKHLIEVN